MITAVAGLSQVKPPDFYTPEMQAIKREIRDASAAHRQARRRGLEQAVRDQLDWAQKSLEEHTRSGNIPGTAVARTAIRLFETCLEELDAKDDFTLPERVRRELTERVQGLSETRRTLDAETAALLAPIEERGFEAFSALARQQAGRGVDEKQLREWFTRLIATEDRVIPAAMPPGAPPPPGDDAPAAPSGPVVLAHSGDAAGWLTLGYWFAEVNAMEIIDQAIMDQTGEGQYRGIGVMSRAAYETRYRPQRVLKPAADLQFRVLSVPDHRPADVVQWPSARNRWTLKLRVRPGEEVPSSHAIELQINAEAFPDAIPAAAPAEPAAAAAAAAVGPATARGEPPAVPAAESAAPTARRPVEIEKENISVFARSGWRRSVVRVERGDRLAVTPYGTWSVGEQREPVSAAGYAPNAFPHYYQAPHGDRRLVQHAPYGALLMRIAETGPVIAIAQETRLTTAQAGALYFGVNEAPDHLGDNRGDLRVLILKAPPAP